MHFGVSLGISPRQSLEGFARQARALEKAGVERIWLIDSQLATKDVYVGLALAARTTRSAWLGTGVTNPMTRHPTVTASSIAAIAELSGGRAVLGLGAGDSAVYGLGWKPARLAQVEAALVFFKAVLSGEEGEWEGRHYRQSHLASPVPVYLAASQTRMCALAGRLADGVILMGPCHPGHVRRQVGWVESGLAAAGRSRDAFDISLVATTAVGDGGGGLDSVRSWASTQARLLADFDELPPGLEPFRDEIVSSRSGYDYSEHLSTHAGHQRSVSDQLTRALAVVGTPAQCAGRLLDLIGAGVDNLIFPLPGGGRLERLRALTGDVLPLVQTPAGR